MDLRKPNIDSNELKRLYEDKNLSLAELGAAFGRSGSYIAQCLRNAGAKIRPRVKRSRAVDHAEAARLYREEQLSVAAVSSRLGVSPEDITRRYYPKPRIKRHRQTLKNSPSQTKISATSPACDRRVL